MRRRHTALSLLLATRLVIRVWARSRRDEMPFVPLLEAHVEVLRARAAYYEAVFETLRRQRHEQRVAEIARRN